MKVKALIAGVALLVSATSIADAPFELTYRTMVDEQGNISLPKDFRRSWASADDMVFTQYYPILRAAKAMGEKGAGVGGQAK